MEEQEMDAARPRTVPEWVNMLRVGTRLIVAALSRDPIDRIAFDPIALPAFRRLVEHLERLSPRIPGSLGAKGVAHLLVTELLSAMKQREGSWSLGESTPGQCAQYIEAIGRCLLQWVQSDVDARAPLSELFPVLAAMAREITHAPAQGGPVVAQALGAFWETAVARLIQTYQEGHRWHTLPEHLDTHALPTPAYSEDVLYYSQHLCLWAVAQAQSLGLHVAVYRVTVHSRIPEYGATFDLTVDEQGVLWEVNRYACMQESLLRMQPFDLFVDEGMKQPQTGYRLRKEYNWIEAKLSRMAGRLPRYSVGPGAFTHELPSEEHSSYVNGGAEE